MHGLTDREAVLQVMRELPQGKWINLPYLVATILNRQQVSTYDFDKRWNELVAFCKKEEADPQGIIYFIEYTYRKGSNLIRRVSDFCHWTHNNETAWEGVIVQLSDGFGDPSQKTYNSNTLDPEGRGSDEPTI